MTNPPAGPAPPLLELRGVPLSGDGGKAPGISMALIPGERLLVVDPEGGGTRRLVRSSVGLERPDAGSVRLLGRDPAAPGRSAPLARVGLVPRFPFAGLRTRLRRHVSWQQRFYRRWSEVELWYRLERFGIDPAARLDRLAPLPRALAALALALAPAPELLLVDDPLADAPERERRLFAEALGAELERNARLALLFATDDLVGAPPIDRLLVLRRGRLLFDGSRADVARSVRRISFVDESDEADLADGWSALRMRVQGHQVELVVDDFDEEKWEAFAARPDLDEAREQPVGLEELAAELLRERREPGDAPVPITTGRVS